MSGVLKNSSISNREQMIEETKKSGQPDPKEQQFKEQIAQLELREKTASATLKEAQAEKASIEAKLAPELVKAKMIAALSNNLDEDAEGKDFERRAKIADLMLKEKSITSDENIARMQTAASNRSA